MLGRKNVAAGCAAALALCLGVIGLAAVTMIGLPPSPYGPLPSPDGPLVLRGGTVFDGNDVRGVLDVAIDGDRITCVAQRCPSPPGAAVLDVSGHFVMPGLIDAHVHWLIAEHGLWSFNAGSPETRRAYLEAGVTSVRSLADTPFRLRQQAEGAENGFAGPRFLSSGPAFTAPGGHPMNHWKGGPAYLTDAAIEVDDPAEARAHAEGLLDADSVGIKAIFDDGDPAVGVLPRLDRRVLEALVEVAHNRNTWVAVHAQDDAEVRIAAELGVDSIEHGFVWDAPSAATLTAFAESGSVLVPTLSAIEHFAEAFQSEALTALQRELPQRVKAAYDAGVPIGVGSDNQIGMVQGEATLREMDLLHAAGLPAVDVLRGATSVNARILRRPDLGVLETGAAADVLVLRRSPLDDFSSIQEPVLVLSRGGIAVDLN